jgi:hypothetical protein
MPNWLRVLLLLIAVAFLGLVLVGVLGYRWMKTHAPELAAKGKATQEEARKFAEGKQSPDCVEEGLRRVKKSGSFMESVDARLFTSGCLNAATQPANFCTGVPTGIIAGATWTNAECSKRGMSNDQGCVGIFQDVMHRCQAGK